MAEIKSAAYRHDYAALRRQGAAFAEAIASSPRARAWLLEAARDIPVLTEFRYGDRILAEGMFTSEEIPVVAASVPYGGGSLADRAFQAVDYFHPATAPDTEHLVVVSMPSLTELEQAIVRLVPEARSEDQNHAGSARTLLKIRMQSRRRRRSE